MAPRRDRQVSPGTRPTEKEITVDTQKSSVFRPTEDSEDSHSHACYDGVVYMIYTVFDEEVGDEVERIEAIPCRRCAVGNLESRWNG
jgi:hypothetical protein